MNQLPEWHEIMYAIIALGAAALPLALWLTYRPVVVRAPAILVVVVTALVVVVLAEVGYLAQTAFMHPAGAVLPLFTKQ